MFRRRLVQLFLAAMIAAFPLVVAMPARADNMSTLLGLVNALRAAHGAVPLSLSPTLDQIDQAWSNHMAATMVLADDTNLPNEIPSGWSELGMNSGDGSNITTLFRLFVNSPPHLANLINPKFTLTGIGVVISANGIMWVTQDFEALKSGATGTTQPPATTTTHHPTTPVTSAPHVTTRSTLATVAATTTTIPATTTTAPTTLAPPTTTTPATATAPAIQASGTTAASLPATAGPLPTAPAALTVHRGGGSGAGWVLAMALVGLVVITAGAVVGMRHL